MRKKGSGRESTPKEGRKKRMLAQNAFYRQKIGEILSNTVATRTVKIGLKA